MVLSLEKKNLFSARSDRVKCVDFHPTEPWVLVALYSGLVNIWNYQTQALVKTIEVCDSPVRCARFIARKNWVITGSDDLTIRVFNYNTLEKVAAFDGHGDFIRNFAVHPMKPIVLSCSDDMTIKMWDWEKAWKSTMVYEGHQHYVMDVVFNPKDPNTFASASLDRTVKIWSLGSQRANYTLEGHEKGINSLDYYHGADKPYLVTASDDMTCRVWDLQSKACVRVLEGHTMSVTSVMFHPGLPIILSGSEDCTLKVFNANTFRLESSFSMSLDRIWSISYGLGGTQDIAIGCDEGVAVIQLGKGNPSASMDSNGKVIWSKQHEVLTANIKTVQDLGTVEDGERILVSTKELGHCDVFPQSLQHSPNGRFVTVLGDGEYIIYTALAWRNKAFGKGQDFAWSPTSNEFVVKESPGKLVVFENFAEASTIRVAGSCERLFGGALIGAACSGEQLCFYSWQGEQLVRRIDVDATRVIWSESTNKVAICSEDGVYILQYHPHIFQAYLEQGLSIPDDGIEEAFELVDEIGEKATSGLWIGDCFVYCNANNRLAHRIGGETYQIAIHDKPVFLLGYLREENRLIVTDKDSNLISFKLALAVLEYETAVLQGNFALAKELLGSIPSDQRNRVARFLESQGMKEEALSLSTDPEYKFDLAMALSRLDLAHEIVSSEAGSDHKWRLLGDKALGEWKIGLAEKCFWQGRDWASLLLLFSASSNQSGLLKLAGEALKDGQFNIAFTCYFMTGRVQECYSLLLESENYAEAAAFARAHLPSKIEEAVEKWKGILVESHVEERAAASLAIPSTHPDLFPEYSGNLSQERAVTAAAAVPAPYSRSRAVSFDKSVLNDGSSLISDTFSDGHTSLEVNTTGTRSILADDMDDLVSLRTTTAALSITDHHGVLVEDDDEFESEREPPPPPPPSLSSKVGSLPSQFDFFPDHPDEPPTSSSPVTAASDDLITGVVKGKNEKSPLEEIVMPPAGNDADDWL